MTLSNAAILEISNLSTKAETLAQGSASDRAQSTILVQRISSIRQLGISSDEMRTRYAAALTDELKPSDSSSLEARYTKAFYKWVRDGKAGNAEQEMRSIIEAGSQSLTSTAGALGGFLIPLETMPTVWTASAQTDPVMSPLVTDFVMEPTTT